MFEWLNKQGVKSSKGFIVQCVSRFTFEYREGQQCISIEVEDDYTSGMKPCEKVHFSAFSRWNNGAMIQPDKQKEIIKNFTEALEFQGIEVVVV